MWRNRRPIAAASALRNQTTSIQQPRKHFGAPQPPSHFSPVQSFQQRFILICNHEHSAPARPNSPSSQLTARRSSRSSTSLSSPQLPSTAPQATAQHSTAQHGIVQHITTNHPTATAGQPSSPPAEVPTTSRRNRSTPTAPPKPTPTAKSARASSSSSRRTACTDPLHPTPRARTPQSAPMRW